MGFCRSMYYGWHNTKATGIVVEVNRRLSTDAGEYTLKEWAEDFPGRKQADLMILRFRVCRKSPEGKVHLVRSGDCVPVNNVYPNNFTEGGIYEFMIPDEDAYKLGAILGAMAVKVNREMRLVLFDEDPNRKVKDMAKRIIKSIVARVRS